MGVLTTVKRVSSSDRLIVGHTTSDEAGGTTSGNVQVWGEKPLQCGRASADDSGAVITIFKTRNASPGSHTIVQDDDNIGQIQFAADDGADYRSSVARIKVLVDGTPGADDTPGRLVFATTADGANNTTDRMSITSTGQIAMGDGVDSVPTAGNHRLMVRAAYDHGVDGNTFDSNSHLRLYNDNAGISGTGPGGGNYSLASLSLTGVHSNGSVRSSKICGAEKLSVYVDTGEDALDRPTILMDKNWIEVRSPDSNREFYLDVDTSDSDEALLWLANDGHRAAGTQCTAMFDGVGKLWMKSALYLGRTRNNSPSPTNYYENVGTGLYIYHGDSSDSTKYCQRLDVAPYSGSDTGDYSIIKWWTNNSGTGQVDTANSTTNLDFKFNVKADGRIQSLGHWFTGRIEHNHASPQSAYSTTDNVVHAYSDNAEGRTTIQGYAEPTNSHYGIWVEQGTSTSDDDVEFKVRASDGRVYSDYGSSMEHGADYAEYFEWKDGNPSNEDRIGKTVVLEDGKIRLATDSDDKSKIIGVISGTPAVVGDAGAMKWHGRWLQDDFGRDVTKDVELLVWNHGKHEFQPEQSDIFHLNKCNSSIRVDRIEAGLKDGRVPQWAVDQNLRLMSQERVANPDYDPKKGYIAREDRKEWDAVGLVGKIYIYKDQPKGTNWIKLSDKTSTIERWLVR